MSVNQVPKTEVGEVDVVIQNDGEPISETNPLSTELTTLGKTVSVQNPLPSDGDSIYAKDIDVANSVMDNFSGLVTDPFDEIDTFVEDITANNPKTLTVALHRTTYSSSIGLGCNDLGKTFGDSITVELLGSGGVVRRTVQSIGDPNSRVIQFDPAAYNAVRFKFNSDTPVAISNITIRKEAQVAARLQGVGRTGKTNNARINEFGELSIELARDIFGNLPVADQFSIWDSTRVFSYLIPLFWSDYLLGVGASNTYVKILSKNVLQCSAVGEIAATGMKTRPKYQPLKAHKSAITTFAKQQVGYEKYFGLFDLDDYNNPTIDGTIRNGFTFKVTENDIILQIYSNSVLTESVSQANWNIDKLDGLGASSIVLDMNYAQIGLSELEWLGVGAVKVYMNIAGINVPIHMFEHANAMGEDVYMRTANLPVTYMIKCVSTPVEAGTMNVICNAIVSGGGHNPVGIPRAVGTGKTVAVASGTEEALIFIRLKEEAYEATVNVTGITANTVQSGNAVYRLLYNPTWTGTTLAWTDVPFSHLQVAIPPNSDNLITNRNLVMAEFDIPSNANGVTQAVQSKLRMGKNLQANANQEGRRDIIVLTAESPDSNEVYRAAINYEDLG